jgi:hypothetical protein
MREYGRTPQPGGGLALPPSLPLGAAIYQFDSFELPGLEMGLYDIS